MGTAAGLYALLAVAFFSPGLMPGQTLAASDYLYTAAPWKAGAPPDAGFLGANYETSDQTLFFLPFIEANRNRVPHGLPLWNANLMAGRPYFANSQSAPFSPLNAVSYVLPFWKSLAWIAILKVFTAAFGAYLLARALALRQGGALLAGLAFGFGLYFVIWVPWPTSSVWAFLPWLLLLSDRVVRRPGALPVAGLAALVAAQFFSGHPESSFHSMFAALAFAVLRLFQLHSGRIEGSASAVRGALAWVAAALLGTGLAAILIVPFAELIQSSGIVGNRDATPRAASSIQYIVTTVFPDYYGRPTQRPLEGLAVTRSFYLGALSLMLAGLAVVVRPTLERLAFAGFALFSLAMVFGVYPIEPAVAKLPGFSVVHNTRMTILFLLCAAMLAGWGLDELTARAAPRRRWVLPAAVVVLVIPLAWIVVRGTAPDALGQGLKVAWGFATPPAGDDARDVTLWSAAFIWAVFAGLGTLLVGLRTRGRLGVAAFTALVLALVAADLFRAGMGQNTAIPLDRARQPTTGAISYLQSRVPARFVGAERRADPRAPEPEPLPPDLAMRYGLYDARGYDYPIEGRYDRLWRRTVKADRGFVIYTMHAPVNRRSLRTLSLLGVADIMQSQDDRPLTDPSLALVYDRPDARVYANRAAMPRAWVVGGQQVVSGEDAALRAITAPGFDPRSRAVVEDAVEGVPRARGRGTPGAARLSSYGQDRVGVRVTGARAGSMLVLNDVWYPGWKARVDGREVPVQRVDYLLRGVKLPAGARHVEFFYRPASFRIGWIISLVTLLGLLAAVARELWRRRRAQAVR